ncbi:hypothetical protein FSB08_17130 [Paraburkholderia sp. JPY432]|uniref:hypothetical protein n=1 Tax=Paraburkholderia youngii TaxID=2782701 RepID=UPI001595077C|nr:hypothetical protein [Paraburkholderia youngii]NVH74226.1 hypothetical protein [Paraburkholderia youngii]
MLKGISLTLMMGAMRPAPVAPEIAEALISAQVTQATEQKSGFSLTFALGKGSGIRLHFENGLFDPPARMVLVAMVNGSANVLMDGVITQHAVTASNEPGQTQLTVTGEDLSRLLDTVDFSWLIKYPAMPAEARVALILAKYLPFGVTPLIVPSINIDVPLPTELIPSHMGTDLQYVTYLAKSVGYVFYVDPGPLPGQSIAYWGPEIKTGPAQQALIVNSDASSNVDQLSFSFDGFSKTPFLLLIQNEALPVPIPVPIPDVNPLSPPLGPRPPVPLRAEPLTGIGKLSPAQAVMVGLAKTARAAEVITGSGSLNVMRYGRLLKARRLVEVRGAGRPHDGLHYVRSVTHQIKPGEYKQTFSLSRNAFDPWSG